MSFRSFPNDTPRDSGSKLKLQRRNHFVARQTDQTGEQFEPFNIAVDHYSDEFQVS